MAVQTKQIEFQTVSSSKSNGVSDSAAITGLILKEMETSDKLMMQDLKYQREEANLQKNNIVLNNALRDKKLKEDRRIETAGESGKKQYLADLKRERNLVNKAVVDEKNAIFRELAQEKADEAESDRITLLRNKLLTEKAMEGAETAEDKAKALESIKPLINNDFFNEEAEIQNARYFQQGKNELELKKISELKAKERKASEIKLIRDETAILELDSQGTAEEKLQRIQNTTFNTYTQGSKEEALQQRMITRYINGLKHEKISHETAVRAAEIAAQKEEKKNFESIQLLDNDKKLQEAFRGLTTAKDMSDALEEVIPTLNEQFDPNTESYYRNELKIQKYRNLISKTKNKEVVEDVKKGALDIIEQSFEPSNKDKVELNITDVNGNPIEGFSIEEDDKPNSNIDEIKSVVTLGGYTKDAYVAAGGSPSEFNKLVNTKIVDIATQEIKDISAYSTDGRLIDEKYLTKKYSQVFSNVNDRTLKNRLIKAIEVKAKDNEHIDFINRGTQTALRNGLLELENDPTITKADLNVIDRKAQSYILSLDNPNKYKVLGSYIYNNPTSSKAYMNGYAKRIIEPGRYDNEEDFINVRDYIASGGVISSKTDAKFIKQIDAYMQLEDMSYEDAKIATENSRELMAEKKKTARYETSLFKKEYKEANDVVSAMISSEDLSEDQQRMLIRYGNDIAKSVAERVYGDDKLTVFRKKFIEDELYGYMNKIDPETSIDMTGLRDIAEELDTFFTSGTEKVTNSIKMGIVEEMQKSGIKDVTMEANLLFQYGSDGSVAVLILNDEEQFVGKPLILSETQYKKIVSNQVNMLKRKIEANKEARRRPTTMELHYGY